MLYYLRSDQASANIMLDLYFVLFIESYSGSRVMAKDHFLQCVKILLKGSKQ